MAGRIGRWDSSTTPMTCHSAGTRGIATARSSECVDRRRRHVSPTAHPIADRSHRTDTDAAFKSYRPAVPLISRRCFVAGVAATTAVAVSGRRCRPMIAMSSCVRSTPRSPPGVRALYDVVMTEGLTPPAAARFYSYVSIAMYEVGISGMPGFRSLAGHSVVSDECRPRRVESIGPLHCRRRSLWSRPGSYRRPPSMHGV